MDGADFAVITTIPEEGQSWNQGVRVSRRIPCLEATQNRLAARLDDEGGKKCPGQLGAQDC